MNVLFLHSYFTDPRGIVGSRSFDLCQGLIRKGHKVTVITQITQYNLNIFGQTKGLFHRIALDGIDTIGINIKYSNKMSIMARLFSFLGFMIFSSFVALKVKRIDIVFATSTPITIVVPALIIKLIHRIPFILELRDIWPDFVEQFNVIPKMPRFIFRIIDLFMKWVYRRADWITTTTIGMTEIIAKKGINRGKLGTILLGSNVDLFKKEYIPHPLLQSPMLKDKFIVGYLGSISYSYQLGRLLDVASLMKNDYPNVVFLIIGRGREMPILQERIQRENLSNVLMTDAIEYNKVPGILKFIKVGYESSYPSKASDHGFDNKFYDYISAGLPILSNYDGDMGNFIRSHNLGDVAETPEKAKEKIIEWLKNPKKLSEISENAKKSAMGELSRNHQVQLFVDLLEKHTKVRENS